MFLSKKLFGNWWWLPMRFFGLSGEQLPPLLQGCQDLEVANTLTCVAAQNIFDLLCLDAFFSNLWAFADFWISSRKTDWFRCSAVEAARFGCKRWHYPLFAWSRHGDRTDTWTILVGFRWQALQHLRLLKLEIQRKEELDLLWWPQGRQRL